MAIRRRGQLQRWETINLSHLIWHMREEYSQTPHLMMRYSGMSANNLVGLTYQDDGFVLNRMLSVNLIWPRLARSGRIREIICPEEE